MAGFHPRAPVLGRIQLDAVVAAGHYHGEQAWMDWDFARAVDFAGGADIRTTASGACLGRNRGRRLAVLPGWAGNRSVSYIHEQSFSEAFQTATNSAPIRALFRVKRRIGSWSCQF